MRFLLDHNVPHAVAVALDQAGHDVAVLTDLLPEDTADPVVAATAIAEQRILVSHDRDMRRVERVFSDGFKARFPALSRLHLSCNEVVSAGRVQAFLHLVEAEYAVTVSGNTPLLADVGDRRFRIMR